MKRCNTPQKARYRDRIAAYLAITRNAHYHPTTDAQEPYECAGHWHTRTISKRKGKRKGKPPREVGETAT